MARVLHGMPIETLPEPGEIDPGDQIVAYSKDGGNAYRADVEDIASKGIDLLDKIYPVGSIYMSVNGISPAAFIGGEWTQIEDCFLLAAGSNHQLGETGGAETVTLTSSQIPSHTHSFSATTGSAGSHTHTLNRITGVFTSGSSGYRPSNSDTADSTWGGAVNSAGAHTHSVSGTTGSTGSGNSHNNMPPYLTVYMWQRVA